MSTEPLASRMRPKNIDEIISQQHLVGPKGIIRRMVDTKKLTSMIFYGPPGIGKTSIAKAISGSTQYKFRQLNAVTNTKKDMQLVVEEAKMSGQVILLLDEIHRLDKAKQSYYLIRKWQNRLDWCYNFKSLSCYQSSDSFKRKFSSYIL